MPTQERQHERRTTVMTALVACVAAVPSGAWAQPDGAAAGSALSAPVESMPGEQSEIAVSDRGTVEMHVSELPIATVLHLLALESRRNIIASPGVTGSVTASLYDVTLDEALTAILSSLNAGFIEEGNFIHVHTNEELESIVLARHPRVTRVFPLNYVTAKDVKEYITPLLLEGDSVTASPPPQVGIGSSGDEGGGQDAGGRDFVVVTARQSVMEKVASLLAEIDIRPRQVLIEATILRAQLNDDNALGIDFTLVGGVDLQMLGAVSTGIQGVALGLLPAERFERANAAATTDFSGDVPPGGISIGIIKDKVGVFLRALEEVTDTTVLANPKILTINKQRAQVIVGRRDGFLTTTVTETQAIQTVEFLETGTQLIFRPFIGDDGIVRVELHPEDSVGFVNAQGLPSEQTTEVTTNVFVRDGHTILIGGLFREVTTDARRQVPWIGNLPLVGQLFRSNADSTAREEVIILLTVHIVKDDIAYADASIRALEDVERIRVGLRQGLMWHGRERIAQSYYHRALKGLSKGDTGEALYNVEMAIFNNARLLEAIRLRERITRKREWNIEGAVARTFMHELIAREKGIPMRLFERPPPQVDDAAAHSPPQPDFGSGGPRGDGGSSEIGSEE
ncbi:MAG: hypothetical protein IID36_01390 [Planctomycetes bacterium]|nr:hypothetical protein [Planctomycetota bacterium]